MVQVSYTKDKGLKTQSGAGSFSIESGIPLSGHVKDTVTGNSVSTVNFSGIKHKNNPAGALEFNLDGKVLRLNSNGGTDYYIFISISDGDNAADPEIAGLTAVELDVAEADINSETKLVDELAALINTDDGLNTEFEAANVGDDLVVRSLRMGDAGSVVSSISDFVGLVDANNDDAVVSASVSHTAGTGSYLLSTGGMSKVSGALATGNDSFVVLPSLTADAHYGARKIVIRPANGNQFILKNAAGGTLHTFNAAGDVAHLIWNGTTWKMAYSS